MIGWSLCFVFFIICLFAKQSLDNQYIQALNFFLHNHLLSRSCFFLKLFQILINSNYLEVVLVLFGRTRPCWPATPSSLLSFFFSRWLAASQETTITDFKGPDHYFLKFNHFTVPFFKFQAHKNGKNASIGTADPASHPQTAQTLSPSECSLRFVLSHSEGL